METAVADQVPTGLPGKYRRVIELHDGASSAKLAIASDDENAIARFVENVKLEAVTGPSPLVEQAESAPKPTEIEQASDKSAVHVCILDEQLEEGKVAFSLNVNSVPATGKTSEFGYYTGNAYFYSFYANHFFKITPLGGHCVYTWLRARSSAYPNSTPWSGGAAGTLIASSYNCYTVKEYWSTSTSLEFRLQAFGYFYSVSWH